MFVVSLQLANSACLIHCRISGLRQEMNDQRQEMNDQRQVNAAIFKRLALLEIQGTGGNLNVVD